MRQREVKSTSIDEIVDRCNLKRKKGNGFQVNEVTYGRRTDVCLIFVNGSQS